jgi:hypothetical protein
MKQRTYITTRLFKRYLQSLNIKQKEESFQKTIAGKLPYNKTHPYFGDERFKSMLLDHYIALEDYETCAWLMQQDNK